jgi:signal peptidase I
LPGRALYHAHVPSTRKLVDWLVTIALAAAFVLVFEAEVAKPYRIPTSSMEPTLHCARPGPWCEASSSDRVIVNRLAYRFGDPKRGQIVVFHAPHAAAQQCGSGGTYVKRLVGLPGDTVTEREGLISVNGKPLPSGWGHGADEDRTVGSWKVPQGSYFFVGDDRPHSCDSRIWGSVPRGNLIGPILVTYWPPLRFSLH